MSSFSSLTGNDSILSSSLDWFEDEGMVEGVIMVTLDMSLSLVSVLLNLMVLNALREKEHLLTRTHNLVLANICCANLVRANLERTLQQFCGVQG